MASLIEKIRDAKKKIQEAETSAARLEGQREAIVEEVQRKFGVKTESGLKKKIVSFEKEIDGLDEEIEELTNELDEIMESANG